MTSDHESLSEKDFINESYRENPTPMWLWLLVILFLVAFGWGTSSWYQEHIRDRIGHTRSMQVSNRDMSLFLWQNPEFMRAHRKRGGTRGYLPGFEHLERIGVIPEVADKYVVAPPELLFRFHIWHRLLGDIRFPAPIPADDFRKFFEESPEWQPNYWAGAPGEYRDLVDSLESGGAAPHDLATLSEAVLPWAVRQAFQGWKNYFIDRDAINALTVTYDEMERFIARYPHYARNYWRNVLEDTVPDYLLSFTKGGYSSDGIVPSRELAPFLRVAVYNDKQSYQR